jgi:hypothetical protein
MRSTIQLHGGIQLVIEAMKKFPTNSSLLDSSCGAVANLALNGNGTKISS